MTTTDAAPVASYLRRLGVDGLPPATLETLVDLHHRHLALVPYENLGIMLGRPPAVDPLTCLARVGETGRAGYCFHQNGAVESALRGLGFSVTRRHGHVWFAEEDRFGDELNHLVLVVSGLSTPANPGGEWWLDVGLGEGFRDPLPLVPGEYRQGTFAYRIDHVDDDGWSFHPDRPVTFTGIEVTTRSTAPAAVAESHARLSTPPDGVFTRVLVVQRRDASGVDSLRGCVLSRIDQDGRREADLTTYDEWRGALVDVLGLPLDDIPDIELRGLWARMSRTHEEWVAAGRP